MGPTVLRLYSDFVPHLVPIPTPDGSEINCGKYPSETVVVW